MRRSSQRPRNGVVESAGRVLLVLTLACFGALLPLEATVRAQEAGAGDEPAGPAKPARETRVAGAESAVTANGWNGKTAAVAFVEGAVPSAPLQRAAKPRPQGDSYVQRFRAGSPTSLNPYVTPESDAGAVARHVLDKLLAVDPDHPPAAAPELAVSWEVTDNGRTCTYRLRKGVQFADGRPFTSADVQFSFDAMRDPDVNAEHVRDAFENVKTVETPDPHTVVVRFSNRHWKAPLAFGRALAILNKGWYEERIPKVAKELGVARPAVIPGVIGFGKVFNALREPCPGTGPYYLATPEDHTASSVRLSPNPFSWRMQVHPGRHNFDALEWIDVVAGVPEFQAFTGGRLDVWVVSHDQWENQLSRDPRVDSVGRHFVYDHIGLDCSLIVWNCRKAPFDDPRVRRAMTLAADRDTVRARVEQGHGTIATCKSKPSYPSYSRDLPAHPYSFKGARSLLTAADWILDQDGDGVIDRDGKNFSFELTVPKGRRHFLETAGILERTLRRLKIEMRVREVEPREFEKVVNGRKFDAILGYSAWPDPWIDLHDSFHSSRARPHSGNLSGWKNEQADQLLEDMQSEFDEKQRTKLFHQFNAIFHAEQPETLLVHTKVGVLLNRRFEGVSIRPTGLQSFDLWVRPENVLHGRSQGK